MTGAVNMPKNMEKGLAKFLRKTIEYLVYLFIFILPWQTKLILQPGENSYLEISFYVSQAILLLVLLLFLGKKTREKECEGECRPVLYALLSFALFSLVSIFFASDKLLAFYHFFVLLSGLSLFFIIRFGTMPRSYQDPLLSRAGLLISFLSGVFLHAVLGIYQFLSQSAPACKYFGLAAHDPAVLGTAVIETANGRWLRAYGGLDHPNILGGVLAISLILTACVLAKKKMLNSRQQIWASVLLFVFYFVGLYALFFTFSRSAWLALLAGFAVLLVVFIVNKDKWVLGRFLALIFFSLFLVGLVVLPFQDLVSARLNAQTRLEQKSITERLSYFSQARDLLSEHALTGVGVGNYSLAVSSSDENKKPAWDYQPVHNSFLLLLVENGVFAFSAFLVFAFFLIKNERREMFALPLVAALFTLMMLDHWLISLPFGILFLFLILGLI